MTTGSRLKNLLFITVLCSPIANAGTYMGLAASLMDINADTGSTSPIMADISLGYAMEAHKIELALMSSIKDDNLNQLTTDIPFASSLLYRYSVKLKKSLFLELILGYSKVNIETSYAIAPDISESFQGVSYGLGFEESLKSIPQLKFKIDIMQLYRGDQLKINSFNVGFRYAF